MQTDEDRNSSLEKLKADVWKSPLVFMASGFGLGLMPLTPGSFATLGGLVIYFCICHWPWWAYVIILFLMSLLAVYVSDQVSRAYRLDDPTVVCLDEFAGILVALFLVPPTWPYVVTAFFLFRLLDIWKPWIIGWVDREVHSGFGMVLDDMIAGFFTWIIVQLVQMVNLLISHYYLL